EYPLTFWSFKHALRFISKRAAFPPLGLLTVAAMLPERWEKRLVDENVRPVKDKDLAWADYVFLGAMSIQRAAAERIIKRCGRAGVKIVAGGPMFTTFPEEFDDVDHLVLGEAEATLPRFLADLEAGRPQRIYVSDERPSLDQTPIPQWDLIDPSKYATMNVQYSRGCPFNCDFCGITAMFGRKVRVKSREKILAELESLYQFGWRKRVFFVDDNFIGNRRWLKTDILPAVADWRKARGHHFSFLTQTSIDLSDDEELMDLMVRAGFDTVFIGIETPDEGSLTECAKVQNQGRDMVACVKKLHRAGLQVQGGFIVGFDSDPASIFKAQIEFIRNSSIVTAMVGLLNAHVGTRLYQRLAKEGRLLTGITGDNTDGTINFVPKMNRDTLLSGYGAIVSTIYSTKEYYRRVRSFLKEFRPRAKRRASLRLDLIGALFKSMIRLGIIGRERVQYWKLLAWSLLRRPRSFPYAVTLAIYGFHFRKVFRQLTKSPA
ncbi:MAG: B12-binding domain-containing radical SAM protein, partial [Proteobacteria bacterium]|nr:B12-binding domain-containing radical SAM protein [Pseudomonadota bacterium]